MASAVVDAADNRTSGRPAGPCSCKATVRAIVDDHGEAHLALCYRLCTETGNGLELHAATLQAISNLIYTGAVTVDSALFDAFDRIDLGRLRALARALPGNSADVLTGLLYMALDRRDVALRAAA
ncbi:hypothetical protein [Pseudaminobacter soli (ex Li et al. 2025)]|uniref:hypothetical protein n=1 Tax=Pseudaminobacter soli (ex Li et al. 2025) TaxID=1295366 RepID=UPI000D107F2E|nr:hypothetical protein [Mesorhizobium soli]